MVLALGSLCNLLVAADPPAKADKGKTEKESEDEFQKMFKDTMLDLAKRLTDGREEGKTLVISDPAGDVFAIGSTTRNDDNPSFVVRKYSGRDGRLLWEQTSPAAGKLKWRPLQAIATSDAVYLAASIEDEKKNEDDWLVSKLSTVDGNGVWQHQFSGQYGGHDYPTAIALTPDESLVVAGVSAKAKRENDFSMIKISCKLGERLWEHHRSSVGCCSAFAESILVDKNGNITVFGNSHLPQPREDSDLTVARYSPGGKLAWIKQYDGGEEGCDFPESIALYPDGSMLLLGRISESLAGGTVYYEKLTADGELVWKKTISESETNPSRGVALKIDKKGNGVALISQNLGEKMGVIHFDGVTGERRWARTAIAKQGKQKGGLGMMLSQNGNPVVLAKGTDPKGWFEESCLAEMDVFDGSPAWEQHYDLNPDGINQDVNGNFLVWGTYTHYVGWKPSYYFTLIKYNGTTGAPVWGARWQQN
jgi:outer membrane protein assembly factor BamB